MLKTDLFTKMKRRNLVNQKKESHAKLANGEKDSMEKPDKITLKSSS